MRDVAVIIPAGGLSRRFGGERSKLLELLAGRSVLTRTIDAFASRSDIAQIIVPSLDPDAYRNQAHNPAWTCDVRFVTGGSSRAASVLNGLSSVDRKIDWIAVHDAARPLVSPDLITRTLLAARTHGASAPALPVTQTIKQATGPLPALVSQTVPRHNLFALQTPQIMRHVDLLEAFKRCPIPLDQITDDLQLLELAGKPVWLIPGDERNLKITTPIDLQIASWHLSNTRD